MFKQNRACEHFLFGKDIGSMTDSVTSLPNAKQWDEDEIFALVGVAARVRFLAALDRKGPMIAAELPRGRLTVEEAVKHLHRLRAAGLVVITRVSERDRRRSIYALAPSLPIKTTPEGRVIDFGFCIVTL